MAIDLKGVAGIVDGGNQTKIGDLMWFTVSEALFSRDTLKEKLVSSGLGGEWLPNEIRLSDAFRRATKAVETKKFSGVEGVYHNYLIREVASDSTMIQRNVVCEEVDTKGKRLSYNERAAIIILDKKFGSVTTSASDPVAQELVEEVKRLFQIFRNHYSSQAVRQMVQSILRSMSPTPVRPSGGVYFVPRVHQNRLESLCRFLSSLDSCEGFKVPLINTAENKDMVRQKLLEHLKNVLDNCHHGLKNDLSKGQIKPLIEDAKNVVNGFRDYENIIDSDIEMMKSHVELIQQQIQLMVEKL
ncbi:hypothetical protein L1765_14060 [Microaerobacter geothermalis]|uniref:DUF6744 family protein n=1 Tax=Microaerobacter geothermalis TaxID=674972 RepID=UPI001F3D6010|nr:DUF6744 family protein [Microaerobacter geothermalis]MCF6095084.1 hypothetical protein [Microaerobacter geothermalis]